MDFEEMDMVTVIVNVGRKDLAELGMESYALGVPTAELIRRGVKLKLGEIAADPDLQAKVTDGKSKLVDYARLLEDDVTAC